MRHVIVNNCKFNHDCPMPIPFEAQGLRNAVTDRVRASQIAQPPTRRIFQKLYIVYMAKSSKVTDNDRLPGLLCGRDVNVSLNSFATKATVLVLLT